VTISDAVGAVGASTALFSWFPNPVSSSGHIVDLFVSGSTLAGVAAGTTQLTLTFATTPAHVPNSPLSLFAVVDSTTQAIGLFSSSTFVIHPAALAAGSHIFNGISTNYLSST
jgi:hypothetical protein